MIFEDVEQRLTDRLVDLLSLLGFIFIVPVAFFTIWVGNSVDKLVGRK